MGPGITPPESMGTRLGRGSIQSLGANEHARAPVTNIFLQDPKTTVEMTARGRRPLTRMFEQWRGRLSEFGNLAARTLSH